MPTPRPILALALILAPGCADPAADERRWDAHARLVAKSSHIVVGRLAPLPPGDGGDADIEVDVVATLKGPGQPVLRLRHRVDGGGYPSSADLLALTGREVLVFAYLVDGEALQFTSTAGPDAPDCALQEPTATRRAGVERTVRRHEAMLREPLPAAPGDAPVRALIGGMTNTPAAQDIAVLQLSRLEREGAVSIVKYMDNRRRLHVPRIEIASRARQRAGEITRHAPVQVVDALEAILTHLTGERFGHGLSVPRQGYDRQRELSMRAWRIYARYHVRREDG